MLGNILRPIGIIFDPLHTEPYSIYQYIHVQLYIIITAAIGKEDLEQVNPNLYLNLLASFGVVTLNPLLRNLYENAVCLHFMVMQIFKEFEIKYIYIDVRWYKAAANTLRQHFRF